MVPVATLLFVPVRIFGSRKACVDVLPPSWGRGPALFCCTVSAPFEIYWICIFDFNILFYMGTHTGFVLRMFLGFLLACVRGAQNENDKTATNVAMH